MPSRLRRAAIYAFGLLLFGCGGVEVRRAERIPWEVAAAQVGAASGLFLPSDPPGTGDAPPPAGPVLVIVVDGAGRWLPDLAAGATPGGVAMLEPPPDLFPTGGIATEHRAEILDFARSAGCASLAVVRLDPPPGEVLPPPPSSLVGRYDPLTSRYAAAGGLWPALGGFQSAFRFFQPFTPRVFRYGQQLDRTAAAYGGLYIGSGAGGTTATVLLFTNGDGFKDSRAPYASLVGAAIGGIGLGAILWAHDWLIFMPGAAILDGGYATGLALWDAGDLAVRGMWDGANLVGRLVADGGVYAGLALADGLLLAARAALPWPVEGDAVATCLLWTADGRPQAAGRAEVQASDVGPPAWRDPGRLGEGAARLAVAQAIDAAVRGDTAP